MGITGKLNLPINYRKSHWSVRKKAREQYVVEQGGLCCHCGQPLDGKPREDIDGKWINVKLFPKTMFKYPVHLHHCHKTDMTIGAVHAKCNAVLWQYHWE